MERLPISLVVIVRNAKDNLNKLIDKHREIFEEIVVLDQGSDDGTFELAKEKADLAVQRRRKGFCEPDRNYACALGHQPFVFLLDDDEELSDDLIENLPNLLKTNGDIFWFIRKNFVDGVDIEQLLGDDIQCRMWKKGAIKWSDHMHEYPEDAMDTKVFFINAPINHFRTLEGLKRANFSRNKVLRERPEITQKQNNFVVAVESLLQKASK